MRILLTGASGFVGKYVVKKILNQKHYLLTLSRSPIDIFHPKLEWHKIDLTDHKKFKDIISNFAPQVVIHLAWQDIPNYSLSSCLLNLQISINILHEVVNTSSCKKILVAGSCWELNKQQGECFESDFGNPMNHFTWAKNSLRNWLNIETSKRKIALGWIRIFYVYGPMQRQESLLPTILKELQDRRVPPIKTPHYANDFIFVEDVAIGFVRAIEYDFKSEIFHLGSGNSTPVWKLCQEAEKLIWGTTVLTQALLKKHPKPEQLEVDFWANYDRSHQVLDWTPQTLLETGIQATWEWTQAA